MRCSEDDCWPATAWQRGSIILSVRSVGSLPDCCCYPFSFIMLLHAFTWRTTAPLLIYCIRGSAATSCRSVFQKKKKKFNASIIDVRYSTVPPHLLQSMLQAVQRCHHRAHARKMSEWVNEQMNWRVSGWTCNWVGEKLNGWMDQWMCCCTCERMKIYEWVTEWVRERVRWVRWVTQGHRF